MVIAEERKDSVLRNDIKKHKVNAIKALEDYLAGHDISLYEIVKEINSQPRIKKIKYNPRGMYHTFPWYFKDNNMRLCKKCKELKPWTYEFFHNYKDHNNKKRLTITCSKCINKSNQEQKNKKNNNPKPKKAIGEDYYNRYMYIINRMKKSINKPDAELTRSDIINYLIKFNKEYSKYYRQLIMAAINYFIRYNRKDLSFIRTVDLYVDSMQ